MCYNVNPYFFIVIISTPYLIVFLWVQTLTYIYHIRMNMYFNLSVSGCDVELKSNCIMFYIGKWLGWESGVDTDSLRQWSAKRVGACYTPTLSLAATCEQVYNAAKTPPHATFEPTTSKYQRVMQLNLIYGQNWWFSFNLYFRILSLQHTSNNYFFRTITSKSCINYWWFTFLIYWISFRTFIAK